MHLYQLRVVIQENKLDEFIDSLRFLSKEIREEQGCIDFSFHCDLENKNVYTLLGKWKTSQAMEDHFKREKFSVLMGAAKVLGEDYKMSIGKTVDIGRPNIFSETAPIVP